MHSNYYDNINMLVETNKYIMNLLDLKNNESGEIVSIEGDSKNQQRLSEMGIIPGNTITLLKYAPMGDPVEFYINGYVLSLRKNDAKNIIIKKTKLTNKKENIIIKDQYHPGIGESGIFHNRKTENPLSSNEKIKYALIGNPNSGKSSVFNIITGSNQHIGNFPGVTVEIKEGKLLSDTSSTIIDLPGIYSLTPYSYEEEITTDFLINNRINGIINIIDITSIERGLFLTTQLIELGIPMVLGLNMYDEFKKQRSYLNINALEERLGIPVVPISAINNQGIEELLDHARHVAYYQEKPINIEHKIDDKTISIIHNSINSIKQIITNETLNIQLPPLFIATKYLEDNQLILNKINLSNDAKNNINSIKNNIKNEINTEPTIAMSSYRYNIIFHLLENIIKKDDIHNSTTSNTIDKILTGKYTAMPCFALIMIFLFYLTFNVVGSSAQSIIQSLIYSLSLNLITILENYNVSEFIKLFIINGLLGGIGTILSFIPTVLCLFLLLSILEDTGYISRVAFIMDKPLRKIGLSGRTIIPILLGFGCTVPAVLSTRTLTSKRDRHKTISLLPFISCSAKLPIYGFFCNMFFKEYTALIISIIYFLGIIFAIVTAYISKKRKQKGETIPFVMELPPYRIPKLNSILINLWQKAKDYLKKTFSIILVATIVIWLLSSIGPSFKLVVDQSQSILAIIAKTISPIFKPLGFGNWQSIISLISGFIAKESVVSTLNVIAGSNNIRTLFTTASAFSYMIFCLLYTPCIAAISSIKNELGYKEAMLLVLKQCLFAWCISFITYQLLLIL